MTFVPLLNNWAAAIVFDVVVLAAFCVGLFLFLRDHGRSDSTVLDWTRRGFIALVLVVMSLGPTATATNSSQVVTGTDVFFAVDITGSMAVDDATYGSPAKITRLQAAKDAINGIISLYPGASFAGVTFGASADLAVPPTPDTGAIHDWLDGLQVEPTAVSNGTQLSEPVNTLLLAMQKVHQEHPNNTIVLYFISDGDQTSAVPQASFSPLRQFVDAGAALGVGSAAGGKVPYIAAGAVTSAQDGDEWIDDPKTHQPAISKEDPKNLQQIGEQFGGTSLMLDATSTVSKLTPDTSHSYLVEQTRRKHSQRDITVWPYAMALSLLCLWELGIDFYRQRRFQ